jgi:hypothetical protein
MIFQSFFDNLKLFGFLSVHRRTTVRQYNEMDRNYIGSIKLKLLNQNDMNIMAKFFIINLNSQYQVIRIKSKVWMWMQRFQDTNTSMLCDFALSVVKAFDTKENGETIFLGFIKVTSFSPIQLFFIYPSDMSKWSSWHSFTKYWSCVILHSRSGIMLIFTDILFSFCRKYITLEIFLSYVTSW